MEMAEVGTLAMSAILAMYAPSSKDARSPVMLAVKETPVTTAPPAGMGMNGEGGKGGGGTGGGGEGGGEGGGGIGGGGEGGGEGGGGEGGGEGGDGGGEGGEGDEGGEGSMLQCAQPAHAPHEHEAGSLTY